MHQFKSMPNFRNLSTIPAQSESQNFVVKDQTNRTMDNSRNSPDDRENTTKLVKLFRSSRPDHLTAEEVTAFVTDLKIKSIVDLKSAKEYAHARGPKLLDQYYAICKINLPKPGKTRSGKQAASEYEQLKYAPNHYSNHLTTFNPASHLPITYPSNPEEKPETSLNTHHVSNRVSLLDGDGEQQKQQHASLSSSSSSQLPPTAPSLPLPPPEPPFFGRHYLVNFFETNYVWAVFNRAPILYRIFSLLLLLVDFLFDTGYKYFVRFYATRVLNREGLAGQYADMIEYSQAPILAVLKLLSNRSNLPALLNCAHGKDRTGIMSALILTILGHSRDEVCRDYAKSSEELKTIKDRLEQEIVKRYYMCPSFLTAKYETMMDILLHIETMYGSVPLYLERIGFSLLDQENLKSLLNS